MALLASHRSAAGLQRSAEGPAVQENPLAKASPPPPLRVGRAQHLRGRRSTLSGPPRGKSVRFSGAPGAQRARRPATTKWAPWSRRSRRRPPRPGCPALWLGRRPRPPASSRRATAQSSAAWCWAALPGRARGRSQARAGLRWSSSPRRCHPPARARTRGVGTTASRQKSPSLTKALCQAPSSSRGRSPWSWRSSWCSRRGS
mmetsp:Transcript_105098/g.285383  ORF Transcript_105098/g.285383 Transcript_105098/m.285383 type:complete len:202 (+) Transcript_105098:158-763(+)